MSTISSVGNPASAWSDLTSSRAASRKDGMFANAGTSGDGTVDAADLQSMLDRSSGQPGSSIANADDMMPRGGPDTNGAMSLLPAPSSTVDFAQQRAGADALFSQIDTDGDGAISNAEFDAALTMQPTDESDPSGSGIDASMASTDADDTPTATDLAAGQFDDLVGSLASALDNSSTGSLTATQADAFKSQFDAAITSMTSADSSSGSSSATDADTSSPWSQQQLGTDLSAMADLVMKQYGQASANQTQMPAFSVSV
jgi:Ca2+-binding EF-hand superfamily protein